MWSLSGQGTRVHLFFGVPSQSQGFARWPYISLQRVVFAQHGTVHVERANGTVHKWIERNEFTKIGISCINLLVTTIIPGSIATTFSPSKGNSFPSLSSSSGFGASTSMNPVDGRCFFFPLKKAPKPQLSTSNWLAGMFFSSGMFLVNRCCCCCWWWWWWWWLWWCCWSWCSCSCIGICFCI